MAAEHTPSSPPLAFRPHPWHGIDPGPRFPEIVLAYIEMVPTDGVKYEIDKHTGYLKVDRPQRFSNFCPTLYGFVPQTFCGTRVAAHPLAGSPTVTRGDGDPLDICVLTDRPISRGEILLEARPIGGLRMVESEDADDKILAVLINDPSYGDFMDISQIPRALTDRLRHYFLTYKAIPGEARVPITVDPVYGAMEARSVLNAARADYREEFGTGDPAPRQHSGKRSTRAAGKG
jgi:inorganic pyrophosphatase